MNGQLRLLNAKQDHKRDELDEFWQNVTSEDEPKSLINKVFIPS